MVQLVVSTNRLDYLKSTLKAAKITVPYHVCEACGQPTGDGYRQDGKFHPCCTAEQALNRVVDALFEALTV